MKYRKRREPTSWVATKVMSLIPEYTKRCGLTKEPLVVFNRKQAKDILRPQYRKLRNFYGKYYGVAYIKANVIWLNPNMDTEQAERTLAHEFIHFRFPYLAHTSQFHNYVDDLHVNKRQFKPYRPKKK